MNHLFLYARPDYNKSGAKIAEISGIRTDGFGPYQRKNILKAFTIARDDTDNVILELNKHLLSTFNEKYIVVSYSNDILRALVRNEYLSMNVLDDMLSRVWLDLRQLTWPLVVNNMIPNLDIAS